MEATRKYNDLTLYKRLFSLAWPHWPRIVGILCLELLCIAIGLLGPLPLKISVDSALGNQPVPHFLETLLPAVATQSGTTVLVLAVGLLVAITLLGQLLGLASSLLRTSTGEKLVLHFRSQLFRHVQRLSVSYHDMKGSTDSVYRIQYDTSTIQYITIDGLFPFLTAAFTVAAMLYITARIDWQLALIAAAITPVLYQLSQTYRPRLREHSREAKKLESSTMSVVQEVLSSVRVVKAFGREDHEQERYLRHSTEGMRARIRLAMVEGRYGFFVGLTTAVGTAAVLWFGVRHVQAGVLTLGNLLLVMSYLAQLYGPLKTIGRRAAGLQGYLAAAERAFSVLDQLTDVVERPNARPLTRASGSLSFQNVSFAYQEGHPVLHNISFEVPAGTRLGIAGRTGAGKTTLVSLLTRFYDPTVGQILLDGVDLRDYKLADLRNQFAIVLQEPVLFSTSIAENIAYARPGASEEEIIEAAKLANAHDFIVLLPEGYRTTVGERGMRLSGGERQRISLARAFLKDAPILLLDEPTSSVDVKTESGIMEAMDRLMRGRTTIMIAHRLTTLENCNLRLEVEQGRLTSSDSARASRKPSPNARSLRRHPAVKAWAKLRPERLVPERIEILKFRDRSSVYRLVGVGLQASNVIAKCCTTMDVLAERRVYEEVCPRVQVSDLRYYGFVEESNSPSSWIFLEDAQGQPYRPDIPEHGVLAGKWLGNLHVAGLKLDANLKGLNLPDRGLNYYLNLLRVGRSRISQAVVDQSVLAHEDRRVLTALVAHLDCLEERWNQIEESCAGLPHTFVHGDLHAGHVQIRSTKDDITLVPIDWVQAGWGIPFIDLKLPGVNLSAYLSTVDGKLTGLDVRSVPRLLELWDALQVVNWIYWEVSASSEWWYSLKNMKYYDTLMSERLEAIGLSPRIALTVR